MDLQSEFAHLVDETELDAHFDRRKHDEEARGRRVALGLDDRIDDADDEQCEKKSKMTLAEREETWGFTYDELQSAAKVVQILYRNPALFAGDEYLAETRLYTMISRDRAAKKNAQEVLKRIQREEKNRKERQKRQVDLNMIEKTKMKQERNAALLQILEGREEEGMKLLKASPSATDDGQAVEAADHPKSEELQMNRIQKCHTCKKAYTHLHGYYYDLCPPCGDLNYEKRNLTANLRGRTILLTGCRIKIGYAMATCILRCGGTLVGTTRFVHDALSRFRQEPDYEDWKHRVFLYAVDLRDLWMVQQFCAFLSHNHPKLYAVINNAAQTIQRTYDYTAQLRAQEIDPPTEVHEELMRTESTVEWMSFFLNNGSLRIGKSIELSDLSAITGANAPTKVSLQMLTNGSGGAEGATTAAAFATSPTAPSSLTTAPGEKGAETQLVPSYPKPRYDRYDTEAEARDTREKNSWTMNLAEVDGGEATETMAINALAPLILNAKLKPLLLAGLNEEREAWDAAERAAREAFDLQQEQNGEIEKEPFDAKKWAEQYLAENDKYYNDPNGPLSVDPARYIINVSAMEGQFYRHKMTTHPHTNMAKAALNMMTRTSGADYAKDGIYMNACDTGWITDESPHSKKHQRLEQNMLCPLDEVDASSRCLDLILTHSREFGEFWKDYHKIPW